MFFTKPLTREVATIPRENPNAQFSEIEQARQSYLAAERAWDEAKLAVVRYQESHPRPDSVWMANSAALCHVNAMQNEDPQLTRLCGIARATERARNEARRTQLRLEGKLVV